MILRPWLWFLSLRSDNRIFQENVGARDHRRGVPTIRCQVRKAAEGAYPPREYCVQYRESDLDFVQRLMEHEGIFYHFDHADGDTP